MRIDSASVFAHTVASVPRRILLAWIVCASGVWAPVLAGYAAIFVAAVLLVLLFPAQRRMSRSI